MTHDHKLPLALQQAQMSFWMRTGELLQESGSSWLTLVEHWLARNAQKSRAETRTAADAADWLALALLPMNAGWQVLNHGMDNARDLTLTAINNQNALSAGMRQALGQWQVDTAQALSESRNAMPFSSMLTNLMQTAASAPAERASQQTRPPTLTAA